MRQHHYDGCCYDGSQQSKQQQQWRSSSSGCIASSIVSHSTHSNKNSTHSRRAHYTAGMMQRVQCAIRQRVNVTRAAAARATLQPSVTPTTTRNLHILSLRQQSKPLVSRRSFASITLTPTTNDQFVAAVDHTMQLLQDRLECEDIEAQNIDSTFSDGVLTLTINSSNDTWVMNKHSVTRQIWLSSPVSGPSKYNWHQNERQWLNERNGISKLSELISDEWTNAFGLEVDFTKEF